MLHANTMYKSTLYNYRVWATHASHSIAFLHFVTLWPWCLTFWHHNHITCRISRSHSLHQVWTLWGHLFWSYRADKVTDTHRQMQLNALLLQLSSAQSRPTSLMLRLIQMSAITDIEGYLDSLCKAQEINPTTHIVQCSCVSSASNSSVKTINHIVGSKVHNIYPLLTIYGCKANFYS